MWRCIISLSTKKSQEFYLSFAVTDGNPSDFLDYGLPYPHFLHHHAHFSRYVIAWAILGFFGTTKSKEFLLDVVARFVLTFPTATRLPWKPEMRESGHIHDREPLELKELAKHLPSLPWSHEDTKLADFVSIGLKQRAMTSEDALFEATRWHLYRRAYAEGTTENITEDYVQILLETENELLSSRKSSGDIKSKARNMARYMREEFVIYDNIEGYSEWSKDKRNAYMREYRKRKKQKQGEIMTRQERAISNSKAKAELARKKVINLTTGLFAEDFKKKSSGKWNYTKIARELNMAIDTVKKYLK